MNVKRALARVSPPKMRRSPSPPNNKDIQKEIDNSSKEREEVNQSLSKSPTSEDKIK